MSPDFNALGSAATPATIKEPACLERCEFVIHIPFPAVRIPGEQVVFMVLEPSNEDLQLVAQTHFLHHLLVVTLSLSSQIGAGTERLREKESRQTVVCIHRQRFHAASSRGAFQGHDRHANRARAVQERPASDRRSDRRTAAYASGCRRASRRGSPLILTASVSHITGSGYALLCASIQAYFIVHPWRSTPSPFLESHSPFSAARSRHARARAPSAPA